MSDDLIARAQANSEGVVVPEEWGRLIEVEVGEHFAGRHRGHDDGGKSGAWLAWDEDDEPRFSSWGSYRLDREYERESPTLGDTVVIYRNENYETSYDRAEGREATGGSATGSRPSRTMRGSPRSTRSQSPMTTSRSETVCTRCGRSAALVVEGRWTCAACAYELDLGRPAVPAPRPRRVSRKRPQEERLLPFPPPSR